MKKILLLLIMLVNLQVVIRCNYIGVGCGLTASAQHMTREAGDNCHDDEDGLWYYYANMALCNNGPEILGYPCHYCNQANDSEEERRLHEWCCPYNPDNQAPWWDDNGGSNGGEDLPAIGTSYVNSGTGGNGGSRGGNTGGKSNPDYYNCYKHDTTKGLFKGFYLCCNLPKDIQKQNGAECWPTCIAFAKIPLGLISNEQMYNSQIELLKSKYFLSTNKKYGDADMSYNDQKDMIDCAGLKKHSINQIKGILTPHKDNSGKEVKGQPVIATVQTAIYNNEQVILSYHSHSDLIITHKNSTDELVDKKDIKAETVGSHAVTIVGVNEQTGRYAIYNPWGYYQTIPIKAVSYSIIYRGVYSIK